MDQKLKRMCAQLLQKTKIRGAEQPCVNACVAMCVCVCVCVHHRKPLDKNVQLERRDRQERSGEAQDFRIVGDARKWTHCVSRDYFVL